MWIQWFDLEAIGEPQGSVWDPSRNDGGLQWISSLLNAGD